MTSPDPVVERVARAIHDSEGGGDAPAFRWEVQTEWLRDQYRVAARAAVAAMGDTTPEPDNDAAVSGAEFQAGIDALTALQTFSGNLNWVSLPTIVGAVLDSAAAARSGGTRPRNHENAYFDPDAAFDSQVWTCRCGAHMENTADAIRDHAAAAHPGGTR